MIERQRKADREALLAELSEGELRKGVVKNIADFGAFVDLGGIDGLLHITDMSWERIGHPSEMVAIDQEIEVMILKIDHEKEKIALGMKQKSANPWEGIEERYPVNTKVEGEVVNVMSYGAFVKLEVGSKVWFTLVKCPGPNESTTRTKWSRLATKLMLSFWQSTKVGNSFSRYETNSSQSMGGSGRTLSDRHCRQRTRSQPDELWPPSLNLKKVSMACFTSLIFHGLARSGIQMKCLRKGRK